MMNFWYAGALAALSRFIRLRRKAKNPDAERIQVNLPEWSKFLIYWFIMYLWCEFVDFIFYILFGV